MAGWGTDEEAIFVSLQKLDKDPAAIAKVKEVYKTTTRDGARDRVRSEMSGTELDLALELLGAGGEGGPMVGGAPGTAPRSRPPRKRLHSAMEEWGTDEEAIYAALIPFNRDAGQARRS